ncbi:MAG: GNAT family N-acetyltransferase [Candidatus Saganbacteria bacterium]|nr:GNAT family N-acetyltransferase [Candidatus Saganbacteria bacterium]
METKIIRDLNEFEAIKDKWNAAQKSPSNIFFLRHEWLLNWWKCFGAGNGLFVVLIIEGDNIVAAAPMMILRKKYFGVLEVRKLQFIAHEVSDYLDFIIVKDHADNFALLIKQIESLSSLWDWAEFLYIPQTSAYFECWSNITSEFFSSSFEEKDVSILADIGQFENFAGYLKSLHKKVRSDVVRQFNNIKKLGELKLEVCNERGKIDGLLNVFFDLHKKKWKKEKHVSQFHDESLMNRYRLLSRDLDGSGMLEMSCLYCAGNIVAMHYGFVYADRYYWYTPTYNPQYRQYSPGKLLLASLIENAIKRGIKIFDLLRGNEQYKYFWTRKRELLFGTVFVNRRLPSVIKYLFSKGIKDMFLRTVAGQKLKSIKAKIRFLIKK